MVCCSKAHFMSIKRYLLWLCVMSSFGLYYHFRLVLLLPELPERAHFAAVGSALKPNPAQCRTVFLA